MIVQCLLAVSALQGLQVTGRYRDRSMLQACGLGSSHVMSPRVLLRAAGRSRTVQRWRPAAATMATPHRVRERGGDHVARAEDECTSLMHPTSCGCRLYTLHPASAYSLDPAGVGRRA